MSGRTSKVPRPTEWFTTTQFFRRGPGGFDDESRLLSVLHAKTMGTLFTACGRDASTWFKSWETPFHSARGPRCPECVGITEGPVGSTADPSTQAGVAERVE